MRNILRAFLMIVLFAGLFGQVAYGQTARKFGKKAISVRLCPTNCTKVVGHRFKKGGAVTVFETKRGWARVSGYIKRSELVKSFGDKITKKPALWVPVSSLVAAKKKTTTKKKVVKKKAKTVAKKKIVKKRRTARLSRTPSPIFRPDSTFVIAAPIDTTPVVTSEPVVEEQSVEQVEQPVEQVKEPVVEVVESKPATSAPKAKKSKGALTWEQVQAKIAAQKGGVAKSPTPSPAPKTVAKAPKVEAPKPVAKDTAKKDEARRVAEAAAKRKADKKAAEAKAKETAQAEAKVKEKTKADAKAKEVADAKAVAKKEAAAKKDAAAKKKAAEAKKAKKTVARKAAEAAQQETATKAKQDKESKRLADSAARNAKARLAAEAARKPKAIKNPETATKKPAVGYQPPKETAEVSEVPKVVEEKVAVILTPKEVKTPKAEPKTKSAEPVYKSADADPIVFGKRPKKYIKALRDKRLRKLPGSKSGVRKDVIIALRHYALGLLNSGECKGIAKGGPSTVPGMLYVICTDDPTYQRQFPLQEESW